MGLVYTEPELRPGETVALRFGGGLFPAKAMFCHGGLLYVTTQRVLFRPHNLEKALVRSDSSVDLELAKITTVGSTRRWSPAMGRRFLRMDAGPRSYLFMFSVRHPTWRQKVIDEIVRRSPHVVDADGWGTFS